MLHCPISSISLGHVCCLAATWIQQTACQLSTETAGVRCRLKGYKDIDFGAGPPQGMTGTLGIQRVRWMAAFPASEGTGLRMAVTPAMLARLKATPVLHLLPHSRLMDS